MELDTRRLPTGLGEGRFHLRHPHVEQRAPVVRGTREAHDPGAEILPTVVVKRDHHPHDLALRLAIPASVAADGASG